jgi:hypothetical protein
MNRSVPNDPLTRDLKRIEFAKRLTWHHVRSGTIRHMTGISLNRLTQYRKRWGVPEDTRRRGTYPRSLDIFLDTPSVRTDAAAVLSLCRAFAALPQPGRDYAPDGKLLFDVGLRLCGAFEAYHACRPGSDLELDDLMLLIRKLNQGGLIRLGRCKGCRSLIVIAPFDPPRPPCSHCLPRN